MNSEAWESSDNGVAFTCSSILFNDRPPEHSSPGYFGFRSGHDRLGAVVAYGCFSRPIEGRPGPTPESRFIVRSVIQTCSQVSNRTQVLRDRGPSRKIIHGTMVFALLVLCLLASWVSRRGAPPPTGEILRSRRGERRDMVMVLAVVSLACAPMLLLLAKMAVALHR